MSEPRQIVHRHGVVGTFTPTAQENGPRILRFQYKNWRGDEHEYVVDFGHPGTNCTLELDDMGDPENEGIDATERETHLLLSGHVITRDGDPRPEMDPSRRRSFLVREMRNIKPAEETA